MITKLPMFMGSFFGWLENARGGTLDRKIECVNRKIESTNHKIGVTNRKIPSQNHKIESINCKVHTQNRKNHTQRVQSPIFPPQIHFLMSNSVLLSFIPCDECVLFSIIG